MLTTRFFTPVRLLLIVATLMMSYAAPSFALFPQFFSSDDMEKIEEGKQLPSLAPTLEKITPAVVNISTKGTVEQKSNPLMQDPFFRHFFGDQQPRQRQTASLGSGVIVDADEGYILTNHHVIANADEITVKLKDGREFEAKLIGSDSNSDVAVIQIEAKDLTEVPLADSDKLRVGDFVMAIGNPFGLGQTVTSGIVSALQRTGLGIEKYEDFIQTDASINPGNSGGALVNLRGELIGINTAIIGPNGGNIGIGFAIPVNMAHHLMKQIIEHGSVKPGLLGIYGQDINKELAEALNLEQQYGVLINEVTEDSAADKAGLKSGDILIEVNGRKITSWSTLRTQIGVLGAGADVKLSLLRDGEEKTLTAKLQAQDEQEAAADNIHPGLAGATLQSVEKGSDKIAGVEITAVQPNSRAALYNGLKEGDIIVAVNRKRVTSLSELRAALKNQSSVAVKIVRGRYSQYILLR